MDKANLGDIIYVERHKLMIPYKHFGIYSGNDNVIHYIKNGLFSKTTICETPIENFLGNATEYYLSNLNDETLFRLIKKFFTHSDVSLIDVGKGILNLIFHKKKVFSAKETVQRARELIGMQDYSLLFQNCEHFAVYCKTGISESDQVNKIVEFLFGENAKKTVVNVAKKRSEKFGKGNRGDN